MKKNKKKKKKYQELSTLKGLIREKGTSYKEVSEELGMSTKSLSDKINGYYCFDVIEIERIVNCLDIAPTEVIRYFFPSMLKFSA